MCMNICVTILLILGGFDQQARYQVSLCISSQLHIIKSQNMACVADILYVIPFTSRHSLLTTYNACVICPIEVGDMSFGFHQCCWHLHRFYYQHHKFPTEIILEAIALHPWPLALSKFVCTYSVHQHDVNINRAASVCCE